MDWDDPSLETATTKMTDWYQCIQGHRDVIRVVSSPEKVFRHSWQENGQWRGRMCSMAEHNKCPYCDALRTKPGAKREERWGLTILHVTRCLKGAKPVFVGRLLAWRFADATKNQLLKIHLMTGKRIKSVDLQVDLRVGKDGEAKAQQFQNIDIFKLDTPIFDRLKDKYRASLQEMVKVKSAEVRLLYLPTPEMLVQNIQGDLEATSFNYGANASGQEFEPDMADIEDPSGEPKKSKSGKKTPKEKNEKKTKEDALDVDDPLEGMEDIASSADELSGEDLPEEDNPKTTEGEEITN